MVIHRSDGATENVPLRLRIDTPIEVDYYRHGGILPYVIARAACVKGTYASCCTAVTPDRDTTRVLHERPA